VPTSINDKEQLVEHVLLTGKTKISKFFGFLEKAKQLRLSEYQSETGKPSEKSFHMFPMIFLNILKSNVNRNVFFLKNLLVLLICFKCGYVQPNELLFDFFLICVFGFIYFMGFLINIILS
jgi:hypothetical protein